MSNYDDMDKQGKAGIGLLATLGIGIAGGLANSAHKKNIAIAILKIITSDQQQKTILCNQKARL